MQKKLIIKLRRDRVLLAWGIGGLILSALLLVYMHTTPWAVKQYASIIKSPKFFPNIGIYGLLVMSAVLVATAFGQTRKIKSGNAAAPDTVELNIYGLIMIAIWAGFIFLNNILGFVLASMICILANEWLCGVNMKRATPYLIAVIAPILFYVLFGKLLKVRFVPFPFIG